MSEEIEEVEELDDVPQKINGSIWKKILSLVIKKKSNVILLCLSIGLVAIIDVLIPYINAQVIATFFSEHPDFSKKYFFITIYVIISFLYMGLIYLFLEMAGRIEAEVGYHLRKEAFEKLQELSFSYYDKTPSGWIIARLSSDSRKLSEIISWSIVDIFWAICTMTAVLIMMFVTSWRLALIIIVASPVIYILCQVFTKMILKAYRSVRKTNSKVTGAFNEGIIGTKTTKTLCLESTRNDEFKALTTTMKKDSLKAIMKSSIFWPLIQAISYVVVAIVLRVGAGMTITDIVILSIPIEVLYLFVNYTTLFFDPVMQLARVLSDLQQAQASAERVVGLIETESDIKDKEEVIAKYGTILYPKRENFEPLLGNIEFKNVSFGYIDQETVLKDFNLHVKAGTSVALVGTTGAGKSTIVNLLCRFYEPTKGQILIDGVDYRDRSLGWLHENLGYVLQTPHLFNGTIKENIAYGKPNASMDEIIEAAKNAYAHDFIIKLKDGYDTMVGEGGAKLSVGERQLISFARAMLINPKFLILDEATSSIDTETEVKIKEVMDKFMHGRTTFIVAHRLSTIVHSDIILVINDGEVKEQGNHEQLIRKKGIYYNLYKKQFIS